MRIENTEFFEDTYMICRHCDELWHNDHGDAPCNETDFHEELTGHWYWSCSPGCIPDSEPLGPFTTQAKAIQDASENQFIRTRVIFRRFKDDQSIIALFPDESADRSGGISSYQTIGQHGAADLKVCDEITEPVGPDEYKTLLEELERIGYEDLNVIEYEDL